MTFRSTVGEPRKAGENRLPTRQRDFDVRRVPERVYSRTDQTGNNSASFLEREHPVNDARARLLKITQSPG